ncbi:hypothetical protein HanPSC8_Chr05g0214131 [Helianthus annuus]|nr:hypothetical protein HanPSC8_Chr05g0214131 [Helianthus annuus]
MSCRYVFRLCFTCFESSAKGDNFDPYSYKFVDLCYVSSQTDQIGKKIKKKTISFVFVLKKVFFFFFFFFFFNFF